VRRLAAVALPLAVALALTACGSDGPGAGALAEEDVDAEHNEVDIAFAQGMVPHHEQAVEMAETALGSAEDPEVLALAEDIAAAQEPEIQSLRAMLEAWGAEAPDHMAGMDMDDGAGSDDGASDEGGTDGMPGMMSAAEMEALEEAEGAEFDELWLTMMVEHHEGAVEMATVQLDGGRNPQARDLAAAVVEAQQAEIEQMQALLGG
jgi:uncharacterized protein (DUF305 family)